MEIGKGLDWCSFVSEVSYFCDQSAGSAPEVLTSAMVGGLVQATQNGSAGVRCSPQPHVRRVRDLKDNSVGTSKLRVAQAPQIFFLLLPSPGKAHFKVRAGVTCFALRVQKPTFISVTLKEAFSIWVFAATLASPSKPGLGWLGDGGLLGLWRGCTLGAWFQL